MSNATEPKRRGRPAKARDEAVVVETVEADVPDEVVPPPVVHDGPPCPRCTRPTQRSKTLLRRYDLAALRCGFCQSVAIEGDGRWWDETTAISGNPPPLVVRAMTLYTAKHNVQPPPPAEYDPGYAAMTSEWGDERWIESEF